MMMRRFAGAYYECLCQQFMNGKLPVDRFVDAFLGRFLVEEPLGEPLFLVLDKLFAAADAFTTDPQLLTERPDWYLDEAGLRGKVQEALERLGEIRNAS
jgi:hypothetical protein